MKRSFLLLLLCCVILTSCKEETVVLSRQSLIQGNWEQYMVTEHYFDREGNPQDVITRATRTSVKVFKDKLEWNQHYDNYSLSVSGKDATIRQNCHDYPQLNKVEGLTNKNPDWMGWTSEEQNVTYKVGNTTKIASKVIRTVEFRRIDVLK